jgi:hypothetical protein
MNFEENYEFGVIAESAISRWLIANDRLILPAYEKEKDSGKGPRLLGKEELVAPDMLVFSKGQLVWVEAKHKTVFTWHGLTHQWTTGIDRRHYQQYLQVVQVTKLPLWILFFHGCDKADAKDIERWPDCPKECPTGLFGNTIDKLKDKVNHEHDNWGRHGMVYWAHCNLEQYATLEQMKPFLPKEKPTEPVISYDQFCELERLFERFPAQNKDQFWRWLSERCKQTISKLEQIRQTDFAMVRDFFVRKI